MTCRHCGIRFLTHPRNAGRQNLHCPFGCRQHHGRLRANARSRKHYETANGKKNKKAHNGKRSKYVTRAGLSAPDIEAPASGVEPLPVEEPLDADRVNSSAAETASRPAEPHVREEMGENSAPSGDAVLPLDSLLLDESTLQNSRVLPYALMLASLIERRTIRREELIAALRRRMRQRSMCHRPHREYVLRYLQEHPP